MCDIFGAMYAEICVCNVQVVLCANSEEITTVSSSELQEIRNTYIFNVNTPN